MNNISNSLSHFAKLAKLFSAVLIIWMSMSSCASAQNIVPNCQVWDLWSGFPGDRFHTYLGAFVKSCNPIFQWGSIRKEMEEKGGGNGSRFEKGNPGNPDGKKDAKEDPCSEAGNPIVYSTGNKIEPETDFESRGDVPLSLHRTYNNYWDGIGVFGANWLSDFDYKLAFNSSAITALCYPKPGATCATPPTIVTTFWAMRPNGLQIKYNYNSTQGVWWEDKPSPISRIVRNADGTYTLFGEDHITEVYSASGYVLSVISEQGVGWTFTYDANNYLQRVTHTSGRFIQFTWTSGQLTKVTDPQGNQYTYSYFANRNSTGLNLLRSATLPGTTATVVTYYYEDSRFPFALTGKDFNGNRYSTFAYDTTGRAVLSKHGSASVDQYSFTYSGPNSDGVMTVVETNPMARQTTSVFVNGKVISVTGDGGANCGSTYASHTYDANGYDSQVTDFNGKVTQFTYAANGQLQQMVEAYGTSLARTTTFQWDPDPTRNRPISVTVVGVIKTSYTYDSLARLATVAVQNLTTNGVPNQARTTTYSYTNYASGMVKKVTIDGPMLGSGDAVTYNYSAQGDLTSQVNSLGQTVTYSLYNKLGEPGHVVGINGAAVDYTYDAQGRVITERTYPNGSAADAVFTYGAGNLLVATTSKDGVTRSYTFDDARRLLAVGSNFGSTQEEEDYGYDAIGNVTSIADRTLLGFWDTQCTKWWTDGEGNLDCIATVQVWTPAGTVTHSASRSFDGLGRLWKVNGNNGQNLRTEYDANSNPNKVTDSLGRITTTTYDALNRPIRVVDAKNGVTQFEYDAGDHVTKATDPRGLVTSYVYDGFGQMWAQSSSDTGTTSFSFDSAGNRTAMTRADGTATSYGYDALGRITSVTANGKTQTFVYDSCTNGKGYVCSISDAQASLANTYTPEGWLSSQTSTVSGIAYTTSYSYDMVGRQASMTYPNGVVAAYTYSNGRPAGMTATINGVTSGVASGLNYLPFGGPRGWTYGNGLVRGNNYDLDGRLTGISTSALSNGTVLQSLTFAYDANNAITGVTNAIYPSLTQSFGRDELARLTSVTSGSGNWTWGYDADGNRTSQTSPAGSTGYVTSVTSNQLTALNGAGAKSFAFDALGNRTSDSTGIAFHYDPFNRLDSSTRNGVTSSYGVNPLGQRVYKATPGGPWSAFIYGLDGALLSESGTTGTTDYLWLGGTLVGVVRNGALYSILTDQLGRPETATSPTQVTVWRASNLAFDRVVTQDNLGGLNLGFPGQYFDTETGLWSNGFRDYDASVGRYVESDPLGMGGGLNSFAYALNSPTDFSDFFGMAPGYQSTNPACVARDMLLWAHENSSGIRGAARFQSGNEYGNNITEVPGKKGVYTYDDTFESTGEGATIRNVGAAPPGYYAYVHFHTFTPWAAGDRALDFSRPPNGNDLSDNNIDSYSRQYMGAIQRIGVTPDGHVFGAIPVLRYVDSKTRKSTFALPMGCECEKK